MDLQAFQDSLSAARNTRRVLVWSAAAALVAGVLATGIWLSRREEPPIQETFTRLTDQEGSRSSRACPRTGPPSSTYGPWTVSRTSAGSASKGAPRFR